MVQVRQAHAAELAWVNACYADIDFVASSEADFIAIAEIDGVRAGLGRVLKVGDGVGELGGMYVLPEYRGRSVAAALLAYLIERLGDMPLFCIPFSSLEPFYCGFGFAPIDPELPLPQLVAEKFAWCREHYEQPVALLYRKIN